MLRALSVILAALLSPAAAAAQPQDKAPWAALVDGVAAAEIVLRDVCLPGILERKSIGELARYERLTPMSRGLPATKPGDQLWRLGSLTQVYAVAWQDGSCSTYVDRGRAEELRVMAERTILARPEGFVRGRSGPEGGGRVIRTVFCAKAGEERLMASVTTPNGSTPGTWALSSTVYRAKGDSPLCQAAPDA